MSKIIVRAILVVATLAPSAAFAAQLCPGAPVPLPEKTGTKLCPGAPVPLPEKTGGSSSGK